MNGTVQSRKGSQHPLNLLTNRKTLVIPLNAQHITESYTIQEFADLLNEKHGRIQAPWSGCAKPPTTIIWKQKKNTYNQ